MNFFRRIHLSIAFGVLASVAYAADQKGPGGFILGSSFEEAQEHALGQEWELVPTSEYLPGQWTVKGSNLSLFVCNGMVSSVYEKREGDLEEFAALVFSMQFEFGEPDIQILSFSSGAGDISTVDARFEKGDGGVTVQLQSLGGERTFSVNHWMGIECR